MKIQAGGYYKTRQGTIEGPMQQDGENLEGPCFLGPVTRYCPDFDDAVFWTQSGECLCIPEAYKSTQLDLIQEVEVRVKE